MAGGLVALLDDIAALTKVAAASIDDIGAAAAYEAYRMWKHNSFLYEPLSADRVQQREGLIGMAIAEGTYLLIVRFAHVNVHPLPCSPRP